MVISKSYSFHIIVDTWLEGASLFQYFNFWRFSIELLKSNASHCTYVRLLYIYVTYIIVAITFLFDQSTMHNFTALQISLYPYGRYKYISKARLAYTCCFWSYMKMPKVRRVRVAFSKYKYAAFAKARLSLCIPHRYIGYIYIPFVCGYMRCLLRPYIEYLLLVYISRAPYLSAGVLTSVCFAAFA